MSRTFSLVNVTIVKAQVNQALRAAVNGQVSHGIHVVTVA